MITTEPKPQGIVPCSAWLCAIGEQYPWRVTKENGYRLARAVVETGATIVCAGVDRTCPPTYAVVRFRVPREKLREFRKIIAHKLERVEVSGGA
jgi:hypothetical protein